MSSELSANKVRADLAFFGEDIAAEALEVAAKTLEEYRKSGTRPATRDSCPKAHLYDCVAPRMA